MKTWKLTLEYDGTRYSGWQDQANAKTIAGEIRKAAEDYFQRSIELGGAGRTDAGVHALAQVAHLRLSPRGGRPKQLPRPQELVYALNDRLPSDINVIAVEEASERFHARHDAVSRSYLYQISTRRTAFNKKHVWWIKDRLNLAAMNQAANLLVGRHDFAAFSERDAKRANLEEQSTIVVIKEATFEQADHLILFHLTASHFLWKMVRRLVGSLVEVGRGKATVAEVETLLKNPKAKTSLDPARVTAPPSGLFLERILY